MLLKPEKMRDLFLERLEIFLSYIQNITEEEALENFQTDVLRWIDKRVADLDDFISYKRRNNEDREQLLSRLRNNFPLSKRLLSDLSKYIKYSGIDKAKTLLSICNSKSRKLKMISINF